MVARDVRQRAPLERCRFMKLRLDGSSLRFRIEREELDRLRQEGAVVTVTPLPADGGQAAAFRFAIRIDAGRPAPGVELGPEGIELRLTPAELEDLGRADREGVYLDREWRGDDGEARELRIMVEKDRKAPGWDATEPWIGNRGPRGG